MIRSTLRAGLVSCLLVANALAAPVSGPLFDANSRNDLVWSHDDGRAAIWLMNGLSPTSAREIIGASVGLYTT